MPANKTTPEAILRSSWSLFHERGYKNTSLQQLADAAGLGKAGLLHHFGSKEGLMHAVIEFGSEWYRTRVLSIAKGEGTIAERLAAMLERQFQLVQLNDGGGCFFANMILETGGGVFAEGLSRFHTDWSTAVTSLLTERFPAAEAGERAYRIFVDYEGSVMLFKLYGDTSHLTRFISRTIAGLDTSINL
jgi:TetR/AcrR family transcriptional repressor of nem operon